MCRIHCHFVAALSGVSITDRKTNNAEMVAYHVLQSAVHIISPFISEKLFVITLG